MALDASWVGSPDYKPPGHTISVSWDGLSTIGAGIFGKEIFGSLAVVREGLLNPTGWNSETFGVVQTSPNSRYFYPTGGYLNTSWMGSPPYSPPVSLLTVTWSDVVTIQIFGLDTLQFGSPNIVIEQFVNPTGIYSESFGDGFVLHWYEYAPPEWILDATWVGKSEYYPPIGTLDVLWQPDVGDQTIAPLSFGSTDFGTPTFGTSINPTGWQSEVFGSHQISSDLDFQLEFYDGAEIANFNLPLFHTFQFDFTSGETLTTVVSANLLLSINDFVDGSTAEIDLDTRPAAVLGLDVYTGSTASIALSTATNIPAVFYDGCSVSAELETNPASYLLVSINDGSTLDFSLSTAIQLGEIQAFAGSNASVSIDSIENYRFSDGACLELGFATADAFPLQAYGGEETSLVLNTYPSEGIGTLQVYADASVLISFTTLPQVLLYPNVIKAGHSFNYDILGHMGIDLNNTACCFIKDDPARIELTEGPAPDEKYDGDKVVFTVDLSTLPRFSLNVYTGETFSHVDPDSFNFNFFEGSMGKISAIEYSDYNFNLCTGNFIPDGDHINVELVASDSICSDSILFFDGESVNVDIQNNVQFGLPIQTGERLEFDFIVQTAWIMNFYSGENFRIPNIEFQLNFYEGTEVSLRFEEKDISGFDGAYMEFNLSTDYDVEFLEVGCLDNEFVPTNENGDPDLDKFNPVPVELDFFSHSIRARCF